MNDKMDNSRRESRGPDFYNIFNVIIIIFLITTLMNSFFGDNQKRRIEITYSQFTELVENGLVGAVQFNGETINIMLEEAGDIQQIESILDNDYKLTENILNREFVFYTGNVNDPAIYQLLNNNGVDYSRHVETSSPSLFRWVLPMLFMYIVYMLLFRTLFKRVMSQQGGGMGGAMNLGKSKAKVYSVEEKTGVTFNDVAGQDEAKESLMEMVDFLNNPQKYHEIGAKQPKGALLVGPPGTGKTLLAKAVAGEANVPFYHLTGSDFVEMFVGVGASRVRDLFQTAAKNAPCIIFIDEIDAIGKKRDNQLGSNDEREQTLNQLLAEMDGFDASKSILVLAATNRPEILDNALLRPGRFDRRIIVEKPDLAGREEILKVHTGKIKLDKLADLKKVALSTSGATGADLANIINEAALLAVKLGRKEVTQQDIMEAVEIIIAGKEKRDRVLSQPEREMVAYHEVGHALVSALQKNAQPVEKITIVPRTMGALGYTMNVPEEEKYLMTKEELYAQINILLGGRAAEMVQFGTVTTGAANDIERATRLARSMITQYGMSDILGPVELESVESRYLNGSTISQCSEQTNTIIDEEIRKLLASCNQTAIQLLEENRDKLDNVAHFLLEKENISGEEFMEIIGRS